MTEAEKVARRMVAENGRDPDELVFIETLSRVTTPELHPRQLADATAAGVLPVAAAMHLALLAGAGLHRLLNCRLAATDALAGLGGCAHATKPREVERHAATHAGP